MSPTQQSPSASTANGGGAVVVGFDNTPAGTAALRWAAVWADRKALPLRVIHVVESRLGPQGAGSAFSRDDLCQTRQRVYAQVCERLADATPGVGPVSVSAAEGHVRTRLAAAARGATLLVIGESTSSRHATLAADLTSHCACPVVVVLEDGVAEIPAAQRPRSSSA